MKHALCLSGGGFKGVFQVAAIKVLQEQGIKFNAASGISTGALNAALIAQNKFETLEQIWTSVKDSSGGVITNGNLAIIKDGKLQADFKKIYKIATQGISKWNITQAITSSFFNGQKLTELLKKVTNNLNTSESILDNSPLEVLLKQHIIRQDFIMPYYFGLTSLESGKGYELNNKNFASDTDLAKAVLASATMPVIWKNVEFIQTKLGSIKESADGGLRTVSPIGQLFDTIERGRENEEWTIWIINCNSQNLNPVEDLSKLTSVGGRVLDVLLNQIFVDDLRFTKFINDNAEVLGKKKVILNIIEPDSGVMGGTLDSSPEIMDRRYEIGRALALNYF